MIQKNSLGLKPLHFEALVAIETTLSYLDALDRDVSPLLVAELGQRIKKQNLINIQIRGEQTSGKSLVGATLMLYVCYNLLKIKPSTTMICADQIDFLDKMRDTSLGNTVLMIDEWNELSTTGYNATTTSASLTQINEVQAQRYVHKIACSPQKVFDPTATIILDVLDKQPSKEFTRCLCSYVMYRESQRYEQHVGYVDISVKETLKNPIWLAYRKRKFEKMSMLMKKNIIDNRKGDESEIILKVVDRLRSMAVDNGVVQKDLIRSYIDMSHNDKFVPISIYGEDKLVGQIYSILILLKNVSQINIKIMNLQKAMDKLENSGMTKQLQIYKTQLHNWKQSKGDMLSMFEESVKHYEGIIEAIREFSEIKEDTIKKGEKEIKGGVLR